MSLLARILVMMKAFALVKHIWYWFTFIPDHSGLQIGRTEEKSYFPRRNSQEKTKLA